MQRGEAPIIGASPLRGVQGVGVGDTFKTYAEGDHAGRSTGGNVRPTCSRTTSRIDHPITAIRALVGFTAWIQRESDSHQHICFTTNVPLLTLQLQLRSALIMVSIHHNQT